MIYKNTFILLVFTLLLSHAVLSQTPPIWQDYIDNYGTENKTKLLDFSYAGYHFSREPIPDVTTWTYYNITDYGAIADDDIHDDEAIQDAIKAAEESGNPSVIFFPPGRFMVSNDNDVSKSIVVNRSHIMFKGSGSGEGGTEIFMDERRAANGHWQFRFQPTSTDAPELTEITEAVARGDFSIMVTDASALIVGQAVFISHKSEEFASAHFGDLTLSDDWTRLFGTGGGMSVFEPHIIKTVEGNKITFENPIQADLPLLSVPFRIRTLQVIEEVGVEDILFVSDWDSYPEDFEHHKDDIHDYGWSAIQFLQVKNGWIRNCEFKSWSENIDVRQSIGVTIENTKITGKKGHASFLTRRGYGLLVKDCMDEAGQHHGPGTGYSGVNTVYVRCSMLQDQSVDAHSGQPYATLLDDIEGGVFDSNGGPHESYPHHARDMVFWNFRHNDSDTKNYDFWPNSRNGNTYAEPIFIGFQSNKEVTFENEGLDELRGTMVEPRSLFDAQLNLRLNAESTMPYLYFTTPGSGDNLAKGGSLKPVVKAIDPDGQIVYVSIYVDDILISKDSAAPYEWNEAGNEQALLTALNAGKYILKAIAVDNDSNKTKTEIEILVGKAPTINIKKPSSTKIIEEGNHAEVEVEVADEDGSIASVDLYLDGNLIGTKTDTPFIWGTDISADPALFNLSAGEYMIEAIAYDDDALDAKDVQSFVVNIPPNISFSTPTEADVFEVGDNIRINIGASDPDGNIKEVKLYLNEEFLGSDSSVPYTWGFDEDKDPDLFNLQSGEYIFRAEATDNRGSKRSDTLKIILESNEPLANVRKSKANVQIYPNPVSGKLNVKSNKAPNKIMLYNIFGELVIVPEISLGSNYYQLELSDLSNGIYFINILFSDGQIVKKIIR